MLLPKKAVDKVVPPCQYPPAWSTTKFAGVHALTATQIAAREGKLTASRVGVLMSGDPERILNLWKEMFGDPSFVPEDLGSI